MNIRKLVYKKNDSNISYISVKNIFGIYLILIIHMILATGCASTRNTGKFEEIGRGYPRWFIYQSENPELVVGFTRNGKGLQRDAEIRYCGYHKGFSIQGVLYVYPSGDFNFSDYHFYYEQQELDDLRDNLEILDKFSTNIYNGDYIACYSNKGSNVVPDKECIMYSELVKPQWVENFSKNSVFLSSGYYYGIGQYPFWGNENDSWITAEEKAIKNIASYIANQVIDSKTYFRYNDEETYDHVIGIYFNHKLKEVLVCERWLDLTEKMAYVMVKIKTDNIEYEYK